MLLNSIQDVISLRLRFGRGVGVASSNNSAVSSIAAASISAVALIAAKSLSAVFSKTAAASISTVAVCADFCPHCYYVIVSLNAVLYGHRQ